MHLTAKTFVLQIRKMIPTALFLLLLTRSLRARLRKQKLPCVFKAEGIQCRILVSEALKEFRSQIEGKEATGELATSGHYHPEAE